MRSWLLIAALVGCTKATPPAHTDAAPADAAAIDAVVDADTTCASSAGESGQCIDTSACAALGDHISEPGHCAGGSSIQCCVKTQFGSLLVLARVEWHPPDFQNSVVHRGVTLFEPS